MPRNRELLLAAPLVLGAFVLLAFAALEPTDRTSGERSLARAAGERGVGELEPAAPLDASEAPGAESAATSSTQADEPAAAVAARSRRGRSAGEVETGGTRAPGAELPGRRAGGSHLYDGVLRHRRQPQDRDGVGDVDSKSRQLERSNDVAEKRGSIVGQIVTADASTISGWCYDWNDLETVANVDVFLDGKLVASVSADSQRPQFDPQNPSNPINTRAWSCASPALLADGDKHWIAAFGYRPGSDSKRELDRSPWTFGGAHWPKGEVVWASDRVVYGWARDAEAPDSPLTVSVLADGKLLGTTVTLGPGHNDEVFAQARAASPTRKSVIQVTGLTGPDDPNLAAAIAAKLASLKQTNHYFDFWPLAGAGDTIPFDAFDLALIGADGSAVALPGQERAGLKFYRIPDGMQAFLFQPSEPISGTWLQVKLKASDGSIEREARGSPFQMSADANRPPLGQILLVTSDHIAGYALDPDVLPGPIAVDVSIDGTNVGRVLADKTFPALYNTMQLPNPEHGFLYTIPEQFRDGKTHTIQVFAVNQPDGVNPEVRSSPASFVGKRNSRPYGWLDAVDVDHASGWAYDPDAGASPVSVEIWVDDVLWKTVTASTDRPDLVPLAYAEPAHGYTTDVPPTLKDGKQHTVRAFALDVPGDGPKQELWGSPKEINAQRPYIGLNPQDTPAGLSIADVTSGAPASIAGVAIGDLIRSFDTTTVKFDRAAFLAWLQAKEVGEKVTFRLFRDPALPAAPPPNPAPAPDPPVALGPNERIVVVTIGSR